MKNTELKLDFITYKEQYCNLNIIPSLSSLRGVSDSFYYKYFVENLIEKVDNKEIYIVKDDFEFNLVASYYDFNFKLCLDYAKEFKLHKYPLLLDPKETIEVLNSYKLTYTNIFDLWILNHENS